MHQADKPHEIPIGPQAFKNVLYGDVETGWLTIFYTSSRQTVWFPATAPIPDLNLEQNCYLGLGIRRRRPQNHRTRGKADDIICFDSPADREAFGRLCRGWQQLFQQAGRDRGWHADSTADLTRVLRIPGFVR